MLVDAAEQTRLQRHHQVPPERMHSAIVELRSNGVRVEPLSLLFDGDFYLWRNPDVECAGFDPVQHFLTVGYTEGRDPNRYFDLNWYKHNNPDVAASGANPFMHYIFYGAREGRKPRP